MEELYQNAYAAIREDPTFKPTEKAKDWKAESLKFKVPKLTQDQRRERIEKKIQAFKEGGNDASVDKSHSARVAPIAHLFDTDDQERGSGFNQDLLSQQKYICECQLIAKYDYILIGIIPLEIHPQVWHITQNDRHTSKNAKKAYSLR